MSQSRDILNAMKKGEEVIRLPSFAYPHLVSSLSEFGCINLPGRIGELRGQGYAVLDRWIDLPSGKRVKAYRMDTGQMALV